MVEGSLFIATDTGQISHYYASAWSIVGGSVGNTTGLYDFPYTYDPRGGSANRTVTATNLYFFRVQGAGEITTLNFWVGTVDAAGTAYLGVYDNTGSGRNARPNNPLSGATGSVSLANAGVNNVLKTVTFGAPVTVHHGDWIAFGTNSATATFLTSAPNTNTLLANGLGHFASGLAGTWPSPVGTVSPFIETVIIIGG